MGVARFEGGGGRELSEDTEGQLCSTKGIGGGGGRESMDVVLAPSWEETLLKLDFTVGREQSTRFR